jgi:predicted methyltransferase
MRRHVSALVLIAFAAAGLAATAMAQSVSPAITAAVNDAGRPAADKARDADRKPAESVAFSGMKPGDKVADFLPGEGYYTRIFSKVVGPTGHVYAILPSEFVKDHPRGQVTLTTLVGMPAYSNASLAVKPYAEFGAPEKLDIVWTSLNYHDLHNPSFAMTDINAFNKAVFDSLKPGGIYYIIDHAAAPGSGFSATQTLHRVDPEAVKKEVTAAGFVLDGESNILRRSTDDHTVRSGDPSMSDKSDQFILKFRRPK